MWEISHVHIADAIIYDIRKVTCTCIYCTLVAFSCPSPDGTIYTPLRSIPHQFLIYKAERELYKELSHCRIGIYCHCVVLPLVVYNKRETATATVSILTKYHTFLKPYTHTHLIESDIELSGLLEYLED